VSDSLIVSRTHWSDPLAVDYLAIALSNLPLKREIAVVCVGTDRSTGDSLGPFIGTALNKHQRARLLDSNIIIYGTLDEPVHALNLDHCIQRIVKMDKSVSTIAIDACLGRPQNIGFISLKRGPLKPGTGVNKKLPLVGDYHIIGVVNVSGFMEHVVLQNTRLSLVVQMADVIASSITMGLGSQYGETALSSPSST
jgi:putative sporulation protein YyaC